jgi:hypothetical protein
MSDRETIQKAYEADLARIYAVFAAEYTAALGNGQEEAAAEAGFQRAIAHAKHIRDRALALIV